MPYRRKSRRVSSRRRPVYRKRRYGRRKSYSMSKVYRFKRINKTCQFYNTGTANTITTDDYSQINLSGVSADTVGSLFTGSMSFALNNVQNATDMISMFDHYKIRGAKITFTPTFDSASSGASQYVPTLYWYQDMDDASIPNAVEVRQRQNIKITRLTGSRSIFVSFPKAKFDVGDPTPVTGAPFNSWLDCNSNTVAHNGLKFMIRNANLSATPGNVFGVRVDVMYYLQFKNPQ